MPRKDKYHDIVIEVLENDGWTITHDPLYVKIGTKEFWIDLGAERELLIANKGTEEIAVEVKTLEDLSFITAMYQAVGKYAFYYKALAKKEPRRVLFMAVPEHIYSEEIESEEIVEEVIKSYNIKLMVFSVTTKKVVAWIK